MRIVTAWALLGLGIAGCGESARTANNQQAPEANATAEAPAQTACTGVDESLTDAQRIEVAALVGRVAGESAGPVQVEQVMRQGEWTAAVATPAGMERGVFFFRQEQGGEPQHVETWGGSGPPGEAGEIAAWARALPGNPPAELSDCFARAVTGG